MHLNFVRLRRALVRGLLCCVSLLLTHQQNLQAQGFDPLAWGQQSSTDLDLAFINALRKRRLYQSAAQYCSDRMASSEIDPEDQAEYAIQLIRILARQAADTERQERAPLWQRVADVERDFARVHPQHAQLLLVRIQAALATLSRAEIDREEARFAATPDQMLQSAAALARQAGIQLDELQKELSVAVREAERDRRPGALPADRWLAAKNNLATKQARAYRNLALCFPPQSDDRVATLTQAIQALNDPLNRLANNDPLVWEIRADLAECYRLLADYPQTLRIISMFGQPDAPRELQQRIAAETIRVYVDRRDFDSALRIAERRPTAAEAELDFAILHAYVGKWQSLAQAGGNVAVWRERSLAHVRRMESQHGPYWGRRADQLLVRIAAESGGGESVEVLTRAGDELYRKRRYDEAVKSYRDAAQAATSVAQLQTAFQLYSKAALVLRQQKRFTESSDAWQQVAKRFPENPEAARTHLLACIDLAQVARNNPEQITAYEAALQEQITRWPLDSPTDQARIWLAQLQRSRGKWAETISALQGVNKQSPYLATALQESRQAWIEWLNETRRLGNDVTEQARRGQTYFENFIRGPNNVALAPSTWSSAQLLAVEAAGYLHVNYVGDQLGQYEKLLSAAWQQRDRMDDATKRSLQLLLVVALSAQPSRQADAQAFLNQLKGNNGSTEQFVQLLLQLDGVRKKAQNSLQPAVATVELDAVKIINQNRATLSPKQQNQLDRIQASALVAVGKGQEALQLYAQLAKANPRDGSIQQSYAELLVADNKPASMQLGLQQWRRVAQGRKPQTDAWFLAKYRVAETQYKLGQKKEAGQLLRYIQVTSPALKKSSWQAAYTELLRKCPK